MTSGQKLFSSMIAVVLVFFLSGCGEDPRELNAQQAERLQGKTMTVYHSPTCQCCGRYVEYLREHGVTVETVLVRDVGPYKRRRNMARGTWSCHTGIIGDYVVEGHVPLQAVAKLLDEQPELKGLTIPGMPQHAPGMGEPIDQPLSVFSIRPNGRTGAEYHRMQY